MSGEHDTVLDFPSAPRSNRPMAETRFPDVMVLAAGLGKRMLPLTETTPKPLLEVAQKPLIDHVVANARSEGARRFVVNAHHHADQLETHVATLEAALEGTRFALSHEAERLLETGGGAKRALPLLESDPFFVMNADSFWPLGEDRPLTRMIERFDAAVADMVLLCVHPRDATGFRRSHDFCLDPRGRLTKDTGAPVIYSGVALLSRSILERHQDEVFSLYALIERSLEDGRLLGVALDARWFHVGDPAALALAEDMLRS